MKRIIATLWLCEPRIYMPSIWVVVLTFWLDRAAVYTRFAFLRENLQ